jgi:beta-aspartyl-peptidase (threonine type)
MKYLLFSSLIFLSCNQMETAEPIETDRTDSVKPVIVIHGGAGNISRDNIPDSVATLYTEALNEALAIGNSILINDGTALEAVEATIKIMEDNPLFNAGRGSVLNMKGEVENDASIMDGTTLEAGAVSGVQGVKNPISLARLVKDSTKHVMLSGKGANQFASEMNVDTASQDYFITKRRRAYYQKLINKKYGTVGCVALDNDGNIAAGTSTGGMMMKKWGRIGDSPIIGAGTYANSHFAGVSCTGHGEYFITNVVAYDIIALMEYKQLSLEEAAEYVILEKLESQDAKGGLIALDKDGNVVMEFNTAGMFRAYQTQDTSVVEMFN